jgi:cell fate (sporulation/competence/biofilm development) regulator YlbF (YheA/YmcA/DUF963 family)
MNVYDKAYELKKAIEQLPEYISYKEAVKKINANEQNKRMLKDFKEKQLEIHAKELSGKKPDEQEIESLKKLYDILNLNPDLSSYLYAEYTFSKIMDDITKIIMEVVNVNSTNK